MNRVDTVLIELRKEIGEKRGWALADAAPEYCSLDLHNRLMAMVGAYDTCLILIDKRFNKGEILKGGE